MGQTPKYVISIKNLSYNYYFDDHKNVVGIAIAAHYSASIDTLAYNMDFPPKCAQSSAQEQTAVPENEATAVCLATYHIKIIHQQEGANSMAVSGLRDRKVLVGTGRAISAIFGINGLRK